MKKVLIVVLTILMLSTSVVGLAGCGKKDAATITPGAAKQVLKVGADITPVNGEHICWQLLQYLDEEINKSTDGRIDLEPSPSAQLGGMRDMLENTTTGTFKIGAIYGSYLAGISEGYSVFDFPYLFKDLDHFKRVCQSDIAKDMGKTLEKANLVCLGTGSAGGAWHMSNSKLQIKKVADMKGLKLRTMDSPILLESINAFGAQAIPMAWAEVYTGLQQKTIDGVCTVNAGYLSSKLYEVNHYLSETEMFYIPEPIVVNKTWWDSLSKEDQAAMQKGVDAALERHWVNVKEMEKKVPDQLVATGKMTITPASEIDKASFVAAIQPVYTKYESKYGELFKRIKALEGK